MFVGCRGRTPRRRSREPASAGTAGAACAHGGERIAVVGLGFRRRHHRERVLTAQCGVQICAPLRSFHADYLEEQRLLLYFGEEDGVLCLPRDRFLSRSRRLQLSAD